MDRSTSESRHRTRLGIALLASVGFHAALFALLRVDVPSFPEPGERSVRPVQIAEAWADRPLRAVRLRIAPAAAGAAGGPISRTLETSADGGATSSAAARSAGEFAARPPALPDLPEATRQLSLAPVPAKALTLASLDDRRAKRGVIQRQGGAGAAGDVGYEFTAASEAAREAGRRSDEGEPGGLGGIGVTIIGGGDGDCATPGGLAPVVGAAVHRFGPGR